MKFNPKIGAILITAALIVPGISFAQSTPSVASLQAQLQELVTKVQQLQLQFNGLTSVSITGSGSASASPSSEGHVIGSGSGIQGSAISGTARGCSSFDRNLSVGMSGSSVTALQTALLNDGEQVTVNGTFDDQTAAAVTGFQEKYAAQILTPAGLHNGTGYAGSATRALLNMQSKCDPTTPPYPCVYPLGNFPAGAGTRVGCIPTSTYPCIYPVRAAATPNSAGTPMNNLVGGTMPCTPPTSTYPCMYPMNYSGRVDSANPNFLIYCPHPTTTYPCPMTIGGTISNIVCAPPVGPEPTPPVVSTTTSSTSWFPPICPAWGCGNPTKGLYGSASSSVLTITSPTAGQTLTTGTYAQIQWTNNASNVSSNVYLALLQNGSTVLINGPISNSGLYSWLVPATSVGSNFQIRLYADGGYVDSPVFTIASVAVTTPQ